VDPMVLIPILHLEIYYGADIPTYCFSIYNGVDTILSYSVIHRVDSHTHN